jgi:Tetracyclin repressor-like, C-terminal domain
VALAPILTWGYHHLADERADVLPGFPIRFRLGESFRKTDHLGSIVFGNIRMHVRHIGRSSGKTFLDLGLLLLQLAHPCLHGRLIHSILDGFENPLDAPINLLKSTAARFRLRAPLMVLAVGLLRIGTHRDRYSFGRHQLVGEARQHAPLDVVAANRPAIVAGPLAEVTETAVAIVDDDAVSGAATSAGEQARQKEGGATEAVQPFRARGTAPDVLRNVCAAYLDFARSRPVIYEAMFVLPTKIKFASEETPTALRAAFSELVAALGPKREMPETLAEVLWSASR